MRQQPGAAMGQTLRVLIVEDCEEDALLMLQELERDGYNVIFQRVDSANGLIGALTKQEWDVILADYQLPSYGALLALATVKEMGLDIPFLVVTGAITNELAVAAMKAGAVDYIMKDRLARLAPAVEREVKEAQTRAEVRRERARVATLEASYRAVFETSGAAIVLVDEDGLLRLVNQQFCRLTGYEKEEIQEKMNWRDFVSSEEERAMLEIHSMLTPLFRQSNYDTVVLDRQGVVHHVIINVAPLPDGRGSVASLLDVTAGVRAKKMEAALQETESMFQTFLDNIGVGIAVFSPERRVLSANRQYAEWYSQVNFSRHLHCWEWCETIRGCDVACVTCPLVQSLTDGGAHNVLQGPVDGSLRHYRVKTAPVKKVDGAVVAVVEMREDVTEQVLAQEELRKLSAAVEQSPSPVIITDTCGHIEYVNPKFTQLSGYSRQESMGKTPAMIASGDVDPAIYQELWQTIRAGGEYQYEFCNKTKTGEPYWTLSVISSIRDAEDEITHYLGIQQDISERKAMENQLRENNEQLAEALQQLKMIQSRLIQQEKLAGIGQLAAGVAHEMNNPLGFVSSNFNTLHKYLSRLQEVVAAYRQFVDDSVKLNHEELAAAAELMRQFENEKKVNFLLEDIPDLLNESADGLKRVGAIVKSLRLFSRVDVTGKFDLYDLNSGLESTLLVARNEIKYSAEITTELNDLPPVEAVGSEINQVILNILVNAAQAIRKESPAEKGRIHIATHADQESVYCSISDTGGGISPEHQARIFEPFFTTKAVGQGTGLGLSISYDIIVRKHGGDIHVDSHPGEGTTFTFRIPLRQTGREGEEKS